MAIIGLSGRIGSGKDTVSGIIQDLTKHPNGTIKFENGEPKLSPVFTWENRKFAGKLKQIVSLLIGCKPEDLENPIVKNSYLGPEWRYQESYLAPTQQYTVREVLQKVGTECMRDNLHKNVWVNALMADYKPLSIATFKDGNNPAFGEFIPETYNFPNWIISDVRFANEAQAIKNKGGILVRIERDRVRYGAEDLTIQDFNAKYPDKEIKGILENKHLHPSETALDNYDGFDYVLKNDGSLEQLRARVALMLKEINL